MHLTNTPCFLHVRPSALPLHDCCCRACITAAPVLPACGHTAAARPGGPSPSSAGQLPSQLRARSLAPSCQRGDFLRHSVQGLRAICQRCCERESGVHCSTVPPGILTGRTCPLCTVTVCASATTCLHVSSHSTPRAMP